MFYGHRSMALLPSDGRAAGGLNSDASVLLGVVGIVGPVCGPVLPFPYTGILPEACRQLEAQSLPMGLELLRRVWCLGYFAGGIRTLLMTWMMPFEAMTFGMMTWASPT